MTAAAGESERQGRKVGDWLLAILRFAVTREERDRAGVMAAARAMDQAAARCEDVAFSFFVRASEEVCAAIGAEQAPDRRRRLAGFLRRIEDRRLRRALEAVLEFKSEPPAAQRTRRSRADLWRGLRQR